MRWKPGHRSQNVEDRRDESPGGPGQLGFPLPGGGGGRLPLPRGGGRRMSLGGFLLIALVVVLLRSNPELLGGGTLQPPLPLPSGSAPPSSTPRGSAGQEEGVDFVSFVLDDLQETWARILPGYQAATLVLFRDLVQSACGFAQAASGPFYCPLDRKVYIDLGFYEELQQRFGAPGDFAQAYVIAHEIGHHVQKLTGIESELREAQRSNPRLANELSVRMELQADCLAGVWGHSTKSRGILEEGDVEEGLAAAAAIGDDRVQRMSTGRVHPEGFTHGSSQQRVRWFRRGLETGDPDACDTFQAPSL